MSSGTQIKNRRAVVISLAGLLLSAFFFLRAIEEGERLQLPAQHISAQPKNTDSFYA